MDENLRLLEDMKKLGLNQYEAKAYTKLLEEFPLNGYSLSKISGVPRSKIYEVLDNLLKKQLVFSKKTESGLVYFPLEPKLFISKIKQNYESILKNVEEKTNELYLKNIIHYDSKILSGRKEIFSFLNLIIGLANKRIEISIWEEEFFQLSDSLLEAEERGVVIKGLYFGYNNKLKNVLTHRRIETYLSEKEERNIIVIIDRKEAITGIVSRGEVSQVSWTNDPGIIDITSDYIVHDLMVNMYSNSLSGSDRKKYEDAMDKVRKEYFE
ncbi:TrmB family transcriptional regulator [Fusobacterium sp. MFO224]|uniref:TrmB family transcriptional regulator n=1 Tax=Fusobacterium sp. MFO224 TaxID=3378070 RepID=UPI0038534F25